MDRVLEDFLGDSAIDTSALYDVERIKTLLEAAAREQRTVSYSELLLILGFRFTRPKMRAVCKTLDKIDQLNAATGSPALAVLVVREGDGLPGQGWWTGRSGYEGEWTGAEAKKFVAGLQQQAFDYWATR